MYQKEKELFSELISIVTRLRGPQGCLWDRNKLSPQWQLTLLRKRRK